MIRTSAGRVTVELRRAGGSAEILAAILEVAEVLKAELGAATADAA